MAWTNPDSHVWTTGETLTAANMNTYIRLNLDFLYGDTAWTAVSYTNSWVDFDSGHTVGFRAIGSRVALKGTMKSGTIGSAAFTLPTGYRPVLTDCSFACDSNGAFGKLTVASTGAVTPNVGSNVYFSLNGVTFDTI